MSIFPVDDARVDRAQRRRVGAGDRRRATVKGWSTSPPSARSSGNGVVLYAATFADDPAQLKSGGRGAELGAGRHRLEPQAGAALDWRARQPRRRPSASTSPRSASDETDNRLDVFPDAGTDAQTVVQTPGVAVSTSHYGDPGFYEPEYRGARAFDGDVEHRVGGGRARQGHRREAAARSRPADHDRTR